MRLRLQVQDPGIGMSAEQVQGLFEPFHQADASMSRRFGGSGLGLAICRKIADLMQGRIGVESSPGQGSTFWFEARFAWGSAAALPPPAAEAVDIDPRWTALLQGARVLVVDDNALNLTVAAELLQAVGAEVLLADEGDKALKLLAHSPVDCVLMDVQMPGMDGLETTRRIRTTLGLTRLPVVAMTANARREDQTECLTAGMDDFLTKPVVPAALYATVARWVGGDADPASTPSPAETAPPGPDLPVFDPAPLSALARGKVQTLQALSRVFAQTMAQALPDMAQALAAADGTALKSLGHKVKSSSASLGALALAQACRELESRMAEDDSDMDSARRLTDRIADLVPQVQAALAALEATWTAGERQA